MVNRERNYGIDCLRVVSMFFVILLHCLGRGGVLNFYKPDTAGYNIFWFFEAAAYCAVDIFALISGYVGYSDTDKPFKMKNYINIWLQSVFLGLLTTAAYQVFRPDAVKPDDYFKSLLPVSHDLYWYLTAYTALYFFIPVLNAAVRATDEKKLKKLLVSMFIALCVYENLARHFKFDRGYSFAWLAILYFAGAAIKKCGIGIKLKKRFCFLFIFLCTAAGWGWKMIGTEFTFAGLKITNATLIAYTSPLTVLAAVFYLIAFSKIRVKGFLLDLVKPFAPGAFAAYIVNCHPLVWNGLMTTVFKPVKSYPVPALLGVVLLFAASFTVGCLILDRLRVLLFRLLHITALI